MQTLRAVVVVAVCPAAEVALLSNNRVLQGGLATDTPMLGQMPTAIQDLTVLFASTLDF